MLIMVGTGRLLIAPKIWDRETREAVHMILLFQFELATSHLGNWLTDLLADLESLKIQARPMYLYFVSFRNNMVSFLTRC